MGTMKYLSIFSGIGGFELGLQNSKHDFECVGYSEIDKYARNIYEKNFPNHICFGDATKINTEDLPDFSLLVGGFPCQTFSLAGKRKGFNDCRGTLFFELARILKDRRPKYFLFENVKGLLSHEGGETFQTIITVLDELGYDVSWAVYNSCNYGVPQHRERLFIKGYSRRECGQEVLSLKRTIPKDNARVSDTYWGVRTGRVHKTDELMNCLTTTGQNSGSRQIIKMKCEDKGPDKGSENIQKIGNVNPSGRGQNGSVYDADGYSPTLCTNKGEGIKIAQAVLTPTRENKRQNGRRMKEDGEPMFTLTTVDKHGVYDGYSLRRLTPVECERLQAFPDNWTKYGKDGEEISDSQRYKCVGNAVTTTVVTAIVDEMFGSEE